VEPEGLEKDSTLQTKQTREDAEQSLASVAMQLEDIVSPERQCASKVRDGRSKRCAGADSTNYSLDLMREGVQRSVTVRRIPVDFSGQRMCSMRISSAKHNS
jgi:hypothetical protein